MELELRHCAEGLLLPVHAQPGARRQGIVGLHDGRLKVAVTTVAEKGKANKEILKVVAAALGLRPKQLTLHSGQTNPRKVVCVSDISEAELRGKLQDALPPS
ncbi:MAG: YggU family protein [Planctomycetaceae bacterium]|nr:YggU family protein [Planctomycetaceae bacterium]